MKPVWWNHIGPEFLPTHAENQYTWFTFLNALIIHKGACGYRTFTDNLSSVELPNESECLSKIIELWAGNNWAQFILACCTVLNLSENIHAAILKIVLYDIRNLLKSSVCIKTKSKQWEKPRERSRPLPLGRDSGWCNVIFEND